MNQIIELLKKAHQTKTSENNRISEIIYAVGQLNLKYKVKSGQILDYKYSFIKKSHFEYNYKNFCQFPLVFFTFPSNNCITFRDQLSKCPVGIEKRNSREGNHGAKSNECTTSHCWKLPYGLFNTV